MKSTKHTGATKKERKFDITCVFEDFRKTVKRGPEYVFSCCNRPQEGSQTEQEETTLYTDTVYLLINA